MRIRRVGSLLIAVLVPAMFCVTVRRADADRDEGGGSGSRAVVLDTTGFWRIYHSLQAPVVDIDGGLQPVHIRDWLDRETPLPPEGWKATDFDDSTWLRGPARISIRTPYTRRIAMRALFTVDDPSAVSDLGFSADYYGGMAVYVNGREVVRRHVPDGPLGPETLADSYPREAFVNSEGELLEEAEWDRHRASLTSGEEDRRRLGLRRRRIEDVRVPRDALQSGTNVLAVEVFRAPYDAAIEELKHERPERRRNVYNLPFNTCEILHLQLSAASPDGISQEAVRPEGFQVWNSDVLAADFDMDFAGPSERLYPLRLSGPRGGIVSGKVVVGSTRPIEGLKATLTPEIPSARIRYAVPWGSQVGVWGPRFAMWDMNFSRYPRQPTYFGALLNDPPDTVPVSAPGTNPGSDLQTPNQPEPVFGAVAPVWVTVELPRDSAGVREAELRIEADGEEPLSVPVELVTTDWELPGAEERRAWLELIQVPDTTALEYDLPLWSEEHWRMMEESFSLIGETSSRIVYLPLICHTNIGVEESMVRWIPQDDGTWEHDFSVLERYLDTAIDRMGTPEMVVLYVWELYQLDLDHAREEERADGAYQEARALRSIDDRQVSGPVVTTDDGSGGSGTAELPFFYEPEGKAFWEPVFDELRAILEERGLFDAAVLGCASDVWPTREEVEALEELSGGMPWIKFAHWGVGSWQLHGTADVIYQATVCDQRHADDGPPLGSHHGWAGPSWPRSPGVPVAERLEEPGIFAHNDRAGRDYERMPPSRLRHVAEFEITGDQSGAGRLGADYWPLALRRDRRRNRAADRFPQSSWRNQDLASSLLAPGPDGPVSTPGFEALREGYQEAEARIVIEAALLDESSRARLDEDLIRRCEELLVERTHLMLKGITQMRFTGPDRWHTTFNYHYWYGVHNPVGHQWFLGSGWRQRSEELFSTAAEVERQLR